MIYFIPKIQIWVYIGGPCNGKRRYAFWPFYLFYAHVLYIIAILSILQFFGVFFKILVHVETRQIWQPEQQKNLPGLL
jgi:hypothetical protein